MIPTATPVPCPIRGIRVGSNWPTAKGAGSMRELIERHLRGPLANEFLDRQGDAALLPAQQGPIVFTTDGYVVTPLIFPGGDIGSLAVFGTANDLAVAGARPKWISLGLILEEGLPLEVLERIVGSVCRAADEAGVRVVCGDTKVVPRGAADGMFITTSGIGEPILSLPGPAAIEPGDALLVSGPIGRHGIAVMTAREGLELDPPPESDSAPLFPAVAALAADGIKVKAMRDATRGGLAAVLHEWAHACRHTMQIDEVPLPLTPEVRGTCELLGLDPLHVACEGTMAVAVPGADAERALAALRKTAIAASAARIGAVTERRMASVLMRRSLDQLIPIDEPEGTMLPRIC
jgi:hydrogenase expression/formation protein HypE